MITVERSMREYKRRDIKENRSVIAESILYVFYRLAELFCMTVMNPCRCSREIQLFLANMHIQYNRKNNKRTDLGPYETACIRSTGMKSVQKSSKREKTQLCQTGRL